MEFVEPVDDGFAYAQQQGRRADNGSVTAKQHATTSVNRMAFMRAFYASLKARSISSIFEASQECHIIEEHTS